jgi:putative peptidoglycan lipid II flippase
VSLALAGYGAGLLGLVAIKVLAPGFYASQDIRTPVRIAIVVLVITQLLNIALVPLLASTRGWRCPSGWALINACGCWWACCAGAATGPQPGWGCLACRWWPPVRCWRCS